VAEGIGAIVVDLDSVIAQSAGRSIPEVFEAEGEAGFRRRETDALRDALASDTPVLVACGGGVVLAPENRVLLTAGAVTVLLTAPLDVLAGRLRHSPNERPLLAGDLDATLAELASRREPLYREVADVVVDVSRRPAEVVAAVLEALEAVDA